MLRSLLRTNPFARGVKSFYEGLTRLRQNPFKSIIRQASKINNPVVLDVGANVGQFGIDLRRNGYKGRIVSFEPISNLFHELEKNSLRHQPWAVINTALGLEAGSAEINVSSNSGLSSSFLEMHENHLESFPESRYVTKELVQVSTLDNQIETIGIDPEKILLKLDVQGFESLVLRGGAKSLPRIPYCYLEVSIKNMYEEELALLPILNLLKESGHHVIDIYRGVESKRGELLQVDILTSNH
jgi:FkbM family methyltransferase